MCVPDGNEHLGFVTDSDTNPQNISDTHPDPSPHLAPAFLLLLTSRIDASPCVYVCPISTNQGQFLLNSIHTTLKANLRHTNGPPTLAKGKKEKTLPVTAPIFDASTTNNNRPSPLSHPFTKRKTTKTATLHWTTRNHPLLGIFCSSPDEIKKKKKRGERVPCWNYQKKKKASQPTYQRA
jgi:hypothetical protein